MPKSKRYTYELARDMVKAVVLEAKPGFGVVWTRRRESSGTVLGIIYALWD